MFHLLKLSLEQFSNACRKTKTKAITLANHKGRNNPVNQSKLEADTKKPFRTVITLKNMTFLIISPQGVLLCGLSVCTNKFQSQCPIQIETQQFLKPKFPSLNNTKFPSLNNTTTPPPPSNQLAISKENLYFEFVTGIS